MRCRAIRPQLKRRLAASNSCSASGAAICRGQTAVARTGTQRAGSVGDASEPDVISQHAVNSLLMKPGEMNGEGKRTSAAMLSLAFALVQFGRLPGGYHVMNRQEPQYFSDKQYLQLCLRDGRPPKSRSHHSMTPLEFDV